MSIVLREKSDKIIGIPANPKEKSSVGIGRHHYHYCSTFGNVVILSPDEEVREDLDLLYLPGGADVNPVRYGEAPCIHTQSPDIFFEYFMTQKLPRYIELGIPVFGVCAGLQHLNVHFGGTLHQHMWDHPDSPDRFETAHELYYLEEGKSKGKKFKVNSHHHQGIDELGAGLITTLVYTGGGSPFYKLYEKEGETKKVMYETPQYELIEAFRHESLPIHAVQYHPEELYDMYAYNRMTELLEAKHK